MTNVSPQLALLSAEGISERLAEAMFPKKINLFGLTVGPSLITAVFVTVFLSLVCIVLYFTVVKKLKPVPKGAQLFLEMLVGSFDKSAKESTHDYGKYVGPYVFSAAVFICFSTLLELVGLRPALADINACLAFGISAFIVINILGFKKKGGWGRAKRFLFNPINLITDIAVPVSLSFRLFGSIVSGLLIMELLYSTLALSIGVPVIVSVITTLFHAFIQAYVFATLTSLFVGEAIE